MKLRSSIARKYIESRAVLDNILFEWSFIFLSISKANELKGLRINNNKRPNISKSSGIDGYYILEDEVCNYVNLNVLGGYTRQCSSKISGDYPVYYPDSSEDIVGQLALLYGIEG